MPPITIALIGCGGIARSAHLPALTALTDSFRLVATVDTDAAAAADAARLFGATAFSDPRHIFEDRGVEAVLVATPEASHASLVIAAVGSGKHVLCEKPIAPTLAEADTMIEASATAGTVFMVAHSRRFTRRYMEIAEAVAAGLIGDVRLVRENERRTQGFGPGGSQTFLPTHWTGDEGRTLGIALLAGIHEADILCWFADAAPLSVFARHAVTTPGNRGVPDFLSFTLHFANGAIGASEIGRMQPPGYPAVHQLELYGTEGLIRARDHDATNLVVHDRAGAHYPQSTRFNLSGGNTYVTQLRAFADAIRLQIAPSFTPHDARLALEVALATVESARTGRPVSLAVEGPA